MTRGESPWRVRAGALAIALAGTVAYASSFGGAFVYDDVHNLVANPHLAQLWPPGGWLWARPEFGLAGRPVASLTFALNHAAGGLDVGGYHAVNLGIHVLTALFLWGLLRRALPMTSVAPGTNAIALATSLLWVVHPLTTGAVTYLYQRCESLMGMFLVATCYLSLRAFTATKPWFFAAAAIVACLLGAGCKETMAAAPLLVLALDAVLVAGSVGRALRSRPGLYAGLFFAWVVIAGLVVTSGGRADSVGFDFARVSLWDYLRAQAAALVLYVRLAIFPRTLVFDYGWPLPERAAEWVPHGLAVTAALGLTVRALVKRSPLGLVGAWFFLILAPSSSFLPIMTEVVVEHRMYLPVAAVLLLVVLGAYRLVADAPRAARLFAGALFALAMLALGARTWARNLDYVSGEVLWRVTLEQLPENARAHYALADIVREAGRRDEALAHYETAVRLEPDEPFWRLNAGVLQLELGRPDAACEHLGAAVRLKPDWALAHYNLGRALVAAGRPDDAVQSFRDGLALVPDWPDAVRGLGIALARTGRDGEALRYLEVVAAARPRDLEAVVELAELRVASADPQVRDGGEALALARRAQRLAGEREPRIAALLAAALAETGDFSGAVVEGQRALELTSPPDRAEHERRLVLYRAGKTLAER